MLATSKTAKKTDILPNPGCIPRHPFLRRVPDLPTSQPAWFFQSARVVCPIAQPSL